MTKDKSTEKLKLDHLRELHKFVDHILSYSEEPSNWPMTQQEQIVFVRTVIYQALKISKSEGYVTTAMMLASEDLAMAT